MANKNVLFTVLFILLSALACQLPMSKSQALKENYLQLRNIWFTTRPEDLGIVALPGSTQPFAIIMDMGIDRETVTIASSFAGDGSMYTSTGGAVIGGIDHENVRKASVHFVEMAAEFVDKMTLVTEYPLPAEGHVKFYVITPNGVYTAKEARADALISGSHTLSPLFIAGNDVITQIRITSGQ